MSKQLIFGSLLIILIGFPLTTSLKCWTCTTPRSCKNPQGMPCTDAAADNTRVALQPILGNLPHMTGNSFECINVTWYRTSLSFPDEMVTGCTHKSSNICSQKLPEYIFSTCTSCDKDLCPKNPAATFSSSLVTLAISVLVLMGVKIFAEMIE